MFIAALSHADESVIEPPSNYLYIQPPTLTFDKSELKRLKKGKPVYKKTNSNKQTQEVVVFRVNASENKIWQTILNYSAYPDWIKNVEHAQVYRNDERYYYVDFLIGHWLLGKFRYSIVHHLSDNSWMKWQLDDKKPNDFSLSIGYWQVIKAADDPGKHDVVYSADFQFKEPRSEYIRKKALKAGLKQASIWLPREAEK